MTIRYPYHKDGERPLKVQLKEPLAIDKMSFGKGLHMAFPVHGTWHIIEHDPRMELCREHTNCLSTAPWAKGTTTRFTPTRL